MRKSDDDDGTFFRSGNRVFCLNGKWYYQTREDDHGPFPSRDAAALDLQRYVDEMRFFDDLQPDSGTPPQEPQDPDFANFSLVDKD